MRTSFDFERYVLTSFKREHTHGVVRWRHSCAFLQASVAERKAEYVRRVRVLDRVCALCPRIASLFCEEDRSKATCECKPHPRERISVKSNSKRCITTQRWSVVCMYDLRRSACHKHLTYMCVRVSMSPEKPSPGNSRLRTYFPKLKTVSIHMRGPVTSEKSQKFRSFLRFMGPYLESIGEVHLHADFRCWQHAFTDHLVGWTILTRLRLRLYVRERWITSGAHFEALLDLPRLLPGCSHTTSS